MIRAMVVSEPQRGNWEARSGAVGRRAEKAMRLAMDVSIMVQCRTGTEEYVEGLVWGLSRCGVPVLGVGRPGQALLPDQPCLGLPLRRRRSPWEKWWWENLGLRRAVRRDVDLVHIPYLTHPPAPLSVPSVVTVHDLIPFRLEVYRRRLRDKAYFGWIRRSLRYATHLVAISQATQADLAQIFPELADRVSVIPNGVHPAYFQEVDHALLDAVSHRYGLARRPRLLYVGGYDWRKNVETLLQAARVIFSHLPEGEMVLVGGRQPAVAAAVARMGLQDRVILTPFLSRREVVALYHAADLFVFPSTYEGFGLPPAQAMAVGVPVVAGNSRAVAEVVADTGVLVDPLSVDAWVDAVERVLATPALAQRMAARGRARAEDFAWEQVALSYARLYERVVQGA